MKISLTHVLFSFSKLPSTATQVFALANGFSLNDTEALKKLLANHIVNATIVSGSLQERSSFKTSAISGNELVIDKGSGEGVGGRMGGKRKRRRREERRGGGVGGEIRVGKNRATVVKADVRSTNGVVHVIDDVIR